MKTIHANQWTRREFTVQSALAMLSGVAITLSSCGDSNSSTAPSTTSTSAPPPPAGNNDITGTVGTNHGHSAVITVARLTTGNPISLDITGNADHPHTVELTEAELGQIAGGAQVRKTSTNDSGHAHTVAFN